MPLVHEPVPDVGDEDHEAEEHGQPQLRRAHRDLHRIADVRRTTREADADPSRTGQRRSAAAPELGRGGFLEDVLLERPSSRIPVDGRPARALVREVRLVDPVVEGLAEIEHGEQKEGQDRQDEGKLDQRGPLLSAEPRQAPRESDSDVAHAASWASCRRRRRDFPFRAYSAFATLVSVVTMLPPSVVRIVIAATETSARISEYSTSACPSSLRIEAIHARIQIHLLPPTIERPLLRGTRGRLACVSHENHDSSDDRTRLEPDNPP